MITLEDIPKTTDKVKTICKRFWKVGADRVPLKECCGGCPLYTPCNRSYPTSVAGIIAQMTAMHEAAEKINLVRL